MTRPLDTIEQARKTAIEARAWKNAIMPCSAPFSDQVADCIEELVALVEAKDEALRLACRDKLSERLDHWPTANEIDYSVECYLAAALAARPSEGEPETRCIHEIAGDEARCNGGGYDGCACGPYSKPVSS